MDIVIPISIGDANTIKENKKKFIDNLGADKIVVIGNQEVKKVLYNEKGVEFIDEDCVYDGLSYSNLKSIIQRINPAAGRRTGWYLQQFLKMGYARMCKDNTYLVWDSDTIPLKKFSFVNEKGQYLYNLKSDIYETYFRTMDKLIPQMIKRNPEGSYIAEHMLFDKSIMLELIRTIESNSDLKGDKFFEKIMYAIRSDEIPLSGFSEFETYGTFVYNYYREQYAYRPIKAMRHGRIYFGINPSDDELNWASKSYDTISFEHFDHEWKWLSFATRIIRNKDKISMFDWCQKTRWMLIANDRFRRTVKEILNR